MRTYCAFCADSKKNQIGVLLACMSYLLNDWLTDYSSQKSIENSDKNGDFENTFKKWKLFRSTIRKYFTTFLANSNEKGESRKRISVEKARLIMTFIMVNDHLPV